MDGELTCDTGTPLLLPYRYRAKSYPLLWLLSRAAFEVASLLVRLSF